MSNKTLPFFHQDYPSVVSTMNISIACVPHGSKNKLSLQSSQLVKNSCLVVKITIFIRVKVVINKGINPEFVIHVLDYYRDNHADDIPMVDMAT